MTALLLCRSCDAIRDVERCFCDNCGQATDSYAWEPSEREEYALSVVEKVRRLTPIQSIEAVPHHPHGYAIVDRKDWAA